MLEWSQGESRRLIFFISKYSASRLRREKTVDFECNLWEIKIQYQRVLFIVLQFAPERIQDLLTCNYQKRKLWADKLLNNLSQEGVR